MRYIVFLWNQFNLTLARSNEEHSNGKPIDVMMKYYLEQVNEPIQSLPFIKTNFAQTI